MNLRLNRASDRSSKTARVPSDVIVRRLERGVYLVDGERVRDLLDVDFTMGGSDARYAYIPKGQVWVEKCLSPRDRKATVVHELAERKLMLEGLTYSQAHDKAAEIERRFRKSR